jgi:hypothetical protein
MPSGQPPAIRPEEQTREGTGAAATRKTRPLPRRRRNRRTRIASPLPHSFALHLRRRTASSLRLIDLFAAMLTRRTSHHAAKSDTTLPNRADSSKQLPSRTSQSNRQRRPSTAINAVELGGTSPADIWLPSVKSTEVVWPYGTAWPVLRKRCCLSLQGFGIPCGEKSRRQSY